MNPPFWQTASFWLSAVAIVVSIASFAHTIYRAWLDRANLRATSTFFGPSEYDSMPKMLVRITNSGRRPAILRLLGAQFGSGRWSGTYLGEKEKGHRLEENEWWEGTLRAHDHYLSAPGNSDDAGEETMDLWFEDSLGQRYAVKDAKKHLAFLYARAK